MIGPFCTFYFSKNILRIFYDYPRFRKINNPPIKRAAKRAENVINPPEVKKVMKISLSLFLPFFAAVFAEGNATALASKVGEEGNAKEEQRRIKQQQKQQREYARKNTENNEVENEAPENPADARNYNHEGLQEGLSHLTEAERLEIEAQRVAAEQYRLEQDRQQMKNERLQEKGLKMFSNFLRTSFFYYQFFNYKIAKGRK